MIAVAIGNYLVSADAERFRIFPIGKNGKAVPITRINHFLYLRHAKTGETITLKRYLHMKQWYWRDSRSKAPVHENEVLSEVATMLFKGDKDKAGGLLTRMLVGQPLAA